MCQTPRDFASDDVLGWRRKAARARVTTGHWPHAMCPSSAMPDRPLDDPTDPVRRALIGW